MRSHFTRQRISSPRVSPRRRIANDEQDLEDVAYELEEVMDNMVESLEKAGRLLRATIGVNDPVYRRAESYWMAGMKAALRKNVGHGTTMEDTINELRADGGEYEDEYRTSSQGNTIRPRVRIAR